MNKRIKYFMIIIGSFLLVSCHAFSDETDKKESEQKNSVKNEEVNERGGDNVNDVDIYDFENLGKAPETKESHDVNDVIKVFFSESTFDDPDEPIAINLKDDEIYVNPSLSLHGFSSYDQSIEVDNTEEVLDILKTHNIQNWKKDYTFEDPETYEDGYIWRLWLQYEDGTVEKHKGKGTDPQKITPDHFNDFVKDLNSFVDNNLDDN